MKLATSPARTEDLESRLAKEVIVRSLRGDASYLREESTAARLGVGRTAVRHVFGRICGRGLIEHVPRCGWKVRSFHERDLAAYLEIREVLELKALDLARSRLARTDLEHFRVHNQADCSTPELDNSLHRYLIEKSNNRYIQQFFDREGEYYDTIFEFAAPETCVVTEMVAQHRAILDALLEQDWSRAKGLLAEHIRAQRPIVEALLRKLGGTTAAEEHAPAQK